MGNKARILVVDDDARLIELYMIWLAAWGYDVTPAEGGREALTLIDSDDYALVICDVKMPEISGIDVRKRLTEKHPDTPCILITGCDREDNQITAMMNAKLDHYMEKPVDFSALRKVIEEAVKH
ncbi:MAG: response regulator [Deltaproteobacteria bacterium]|nr:response regulator [Deltaproteobacteria bacterium]